jgi:methylmalonyl-CoA mutase
MRRIMQAKGAEVIHLGHNRSAQEIVEAAIQEDAQGIALTSYQGGHVEFFKYMHDLLKERNCGHIKIFGGGGGTILPTEIEELHQYGITKIYSPDDGRTLGLEGMIEEVVNACDFETVNTFSGDADKLKSEGMEIDCTINYTGRERKINGKNATVNYSCFRHYRNRRSRKIFGNR